MWNGRESDIHARRDTKSLDVCLIKDRWVLYSLEADSAHVSVTTKEVEQKGWWGGLW